MYVCMSGRFTEAKGGRVQVIISEQLYFERVLSFNIN